MIVFNSNTIIQLLVVAIPTLIAMGLAHLMDGDGRQWGALTGAVCLILVDGLWRLAAVSGSDEDEPEEPSEDEEAAASGPLALVLPSGGGHFMFLPNWLVGGLAVYGLLTGFLTA